MTPTLIVPGPAEDWLPTAIVASPFIANVHEPKLCWVPVTTLPAVPSDEWVSEDRGGGYSEIVAEPRPLRAGDTVELALAGPPNTLSVHRERKLTEFATAVVAEVLPIHGIDDGRHDDKPSVEIRDEGTTHYYSQWWCDTGWDQLEEAGCTDGEVIDLPGAQPGGWAIRLTNVEALSGHVDSAVTPEEAQALRVESINERHARLHPPTPTPEDS